MTTIVVERQASNVASRNNVIMIILGVGILALGMLLVQYGFAGMNTPHTCPANQLGCSTTAYVPDLGAAVGGFSMVLLGSALFILRGKFSVTRGAAFGVIVAAIIIAIIFA